MTIDLNDEPTIAKIRDDVTSRGGDFDLNKLVMELNFDKKLNIGDYAEYKSYICGGECLGTNFKDETTIDYNAVPHSILTKIQGSTGNYFATFTNVDNFRLERNGDKVNVYGTVNFSCNDRINSSLGVYEYRRTPVFDDGSISTIDNTNGYLTLYDYFYRPESDNYSYYRKDSNFTGTPYFNACLIGFKYNITFSYEE